MATSSLAIAKLKVTADRTVLTANESLTLVIESDQNNDRPDLSVLEKDFDIMSQNHSQNFSIINGKSSRKNTWTVLLMPKTVGEVTVPPIKFGDEISQPIHLVIHKSVNPLKNPNAKDSANQDVFINIALTPPDKVYVQQQLTLSIQIFTRIQLSNLSLSTINIDNVLLEQIGEDKQFTKIINQQTYQVIERNYALFPQKSGPLTIPGLRFEAMTVGKRSSNWPFFSNQGKAIRRQSDPLKIEVMPKPANFKGKNWLPAESIQISSQKTKLGELKVGDSLTITDTIMGQGVLGSLLPSIRFPEIDGLKLYPDKPQITSDSYNGKIIGQREEKIAIIPTQAGTYQIPDRKFSWWNTTTNQLEEETIPGFKFQVLAAQVSANPTQQMSLPQATAQNQTSTKPEKPVTTISNSGYSSVLNNPWFWSTVILTVLYIMTILFVLLRNKSPNEKNMQPQQMTYQSQEKLLLQELSHNCKNNLTKPSMQSLIKWANLYFYKDKANRGEKFSSLSEIIKKIADPNLTKAIKQLDAVIYAPNHAQNWRGEELLDALRRFIKQQQTAKKPDEYKLPPLNPV